MAAVAELIDLHDRDAVARRRPLLVAHRGAVGPGAPENSLAALAAAADAGYDLVEFDVELTRDGVPVLFHHDRAGTMWDGCGIDASLRDLTSAELSAVRYRASEHGIPTLEAALSVCAGRRLGVVLDLKIEPAPLACLAHMARLLERFALSDATLLLSEDPAVQSALAGHVVPIASRADRQRALAGETVPLGGRFWPAFADHLPADEVPALRANGALVLASVSPRRYPAHAHRQLALGDIVRLREAGVDAFLIDDEYRDLFGQSAPGPAAGPPPRESP